MQNLDSAVLNDLLHRGEILVFAGAGISKEPPAGLPDWGQLRDLTLQAICERDPKLAGFLPLLSNVDILGDSSHKGLTPEVVASAIASECAGYFESFRVLEDGTPNVNHRCLAQLAKHGLLRYIVTTNFDLFLERALEAEDVPYQVYRTEQEFANFHYDSQSRQTHVFKIHGCISAPPTITATVQQEGRGLSFGKSQALSALLPHFVFLFWGYSGADLKLDLDYLSMVSHKDEAKGFIWNLYASEHEVEPPHPAVQQLVDLYQGRGHLIHGLLPNALTSQAASQHYIQSTPEDVAAQTRAKNERLRDELKKWAVSSVHPIMSAAICGELLKHIGRTQEAIACFELQSELALEAGAGRDYVDALSSVADIRRQQGDMAAALICCEQAERVANQ